MTDQTLNHSKRFKVSERCADGYFKVIDSQKAAYEGTSPQKHPDVICKAASKTKADHIAKALNIYNLMQNSGSGIHALNPDTLETIKTHEL